MNPYLKSYQKLKKKKKKRKKCNVDWLENEKKKKMGGVQLTSTKLNE